MLYYILRILVRWYSQYFYSKTYFTGMDKIPDNQPIILAVNHPTAFIEPAYIGGSTLKARNFMLRGDMFGKGKLTAMFLRSIKCIPIYRAQDGMANLKKNEGILNYCYELLNKGQNLLILAEGESKHEKRLRTIQKGTARMAFGAYEKYGRKDIAIVPVGINYSASNEFRSKVYADFGPPIPIADYFEAYEKNPRRAVKLLTDKIALELRKRVIHVANEADDELADQILKVVENDKMDAPLPMQSTQPSRLFQFVELIERLNKVEAAPKAELAEKANTYFEKLKSLKVKDIGVRQTQYYSWKTIVALVIGFIPFLVGRIANFLPTTIAKNYADKNIKQEKFYASVQIGLGAVVYFIYINTLILLAAIFGNIWWVFLAMLLPFFGQFSAIWMDYAKKWNEGRKVSGLGEGAIAELRKMRSEVKL